MEMFLHNRKILQRNGTERKKETRNQWDTAMRECLTLPHPLPDSPLHREFRGKRSQQSRAARMFKKETAADQLEERCTYHRQDGHNQDHEQEDLAFGIPANTNQGYSQKQLA